MKRYSNKCILFFTDTHFPYESKHTMSFLQAVKKRFTPDRIVCGGDLIDNYNGSRWPKDPDHPDSLFNEFNKVKAKISKLSKLFPEMLWCKGNHDDRLYLKAMGSGVPTSMMLPLVDVLGAPDTWKYKEMFTLTVDNKTRDRVTFQHHRGMNTMLIAQRLGRSFCAGHAHGKALIAPVTAGEGIYYGVSSPTLISNKGAPFRYAKIADINPIRGCTIFENGVPRFIIMDKKGNMVN